MTSSGSARRAGTLSAMHLMPDSQMERPPMKDIDEVWIVMHDDSLNDPVLAVCATQGEARIVMDEIAPRFPVDSVSLVAFRFGWRYDQAAQEYRAETL